MIIWPTPELPQINLWSVPYKGVPYKGVPYPIVPRKNIMTTEVIVKVPEGMGDNLSVLVHSHNGTVKVEKGSQRSFYIYPGHSVFVEEITIND